MCACVMENLSDYQIMRQALIEHKTLPRFAEDITTYMVNTLLNTSDLVMDHVDKKKMVAHFINPDLCKITEELVFTEPYNNISNQNSFSAPLLPFVKKELYEDVALHLQIAAAKFAFMTHAQALLHGDLHTGSIFVKQDRTRVFDPEFAFFGPIGYDVGNVVANLMFAWNHGYATADMRFCDWVISTIEDCIDLFCQKFKAAFRTFNADSMAKVPGFIDEYLQRILADTATYAGTELIRRTVGIAKVKDISDIADAALHMQAEKINILCGKEMIMHSNAFHVGADFSRALLHAKDAVIIRRD